MTTRGRIGLVAAVLGMGVFASSAGAVITQNFFGFDPDGTGGLATIPNVVEFGYATDNSLAVNGQVAINNFVANGFSTGPLATTFNTYSQSRLVNLTNLGNTIIIPGPITSGGEYTAVLGFQEQVVAVNAVPPGSVGGFAQFKATGAADTGTPGTSGYIANYFKLFYDPSAEADPLAGTGYNDGGVGGAILILSGTVRGDAIATTNFSIIGGGAGTPLDAHGTNDYPLIDSVLGTGSSLVTIHPTFQDYNFFKDTLVDFSIFNTFNNLNFTSVDPARVFQIGDPVTITPNLGAINGASGPDVEFMTRGTQTFVAVPTGIPEPVTATLGMLGLAALGLVIGRRRTA